MQSLFPSRQSLRHRPCPSSTSSSSLSSLSSPFYRPSTVVGLCHPRREHLGLPGTRLVSFSRPRTRLSFRYLHRCFLVPLSFPFSGVLVPRGCLPSTLLFRRSCCDLASVAFHQCCLLWFSGLLLTFAASPSEEKTRTDSLVSCLPLALGFPPFSSWRFSSSSSGTHASLKLHAQRFSWISHHSCDNSFPEEALAIAQRR